MKKTAIVGSLALVALLTPTAASAAPTGSATAASQTGDAVTNTALAAIAQAASSAKLGSATSAVTAVANGYMQSFGAAAVYYSEATGAHAVTGAILAHYKDAASDVATIGFPTSDAVAGPSGSVVQSFKDGQIVNSQATGTKTVRGAINGDYKALGSVNSQLSLPTSDEFTGLTGARVSSFRNGTIIWSAATGAHGVYGAIYNDYAGLNWENGPLGKPKSDEFTGSTGARVNSFEGGTIIWSPSTGAHAVYGANYNTFAGLNWENGPLGKPKTDEFTGRTGARVNSFEGGAIIWSPATGSHAVYGAIYNEFAALGYEGGVLGHPVTNEFTGTTGARVSKFQNGLIIWTGRTGAHAVRGAILNQFAHFGYEGGTLGAPTSDEYPIAGGQEQQFEHGKLTLVNGQFVDALSKPAATAQPASGSAQKQPLSGSAPSSSQRQRIVDFARSQVGKAYVTGGTGPNAYDCSGFVQAAYAAAGISIPRVSWSQLGAGRVIPLSSAQPGDIVGFYGGEHVSIYIGNGQVIHAGNYSTGVEYNNVAWMPYYETVTYL